MSTRSFPASTVRSVGGQDGRAPSVLASVSNLASHELFDHQSSSGRSRAVLPEELETRGGWSVVTEPHLSAMTSAIVEDNYNSMLQHLQQLREQSNKLSGFKIEVTTRAGVRISCRNIFVGHLFCLCASPRVLQLLQQHNVLNPAMFAKKVQLVIDFDPSNNQSEDSVFSISVRKLTWNSVPTFFMFLLRDSFDSFEWLLRQGFLRKLTDTDADGRNILHSAIEFECPTILKRLLTKETCCGHHTLGQLLHQRQKSTKETPMLKACRADNAAMLLVFLESLPTPFTDGEMDASGEQQSLISAVIQNVSDPAISSQLISLLIRRGCKPDTAIFDKRSCIETLIAAEHFTGGELCHLVNQLVKSGAKVDLSVMIRCLSCRFRSDQEIREIATQLLQASGSSALVDSQMLEMREIGEDSFDMESNVVVQMLGNPKILPGTVQYLLNHFSRYVNVRDIFPSVQQLATALVLGIRSELRIGDNDEDSDEGRASLTPDALSQVLESLSAFTASAHQDSVRLMRYKDSLFYYIVLHLFKETNLDQSRLPKDKLSQLLPQYLLVMEKAELDMNGTVDGRVSMFVAFNSNCPGWLCLSLLRNLPKSFRLNVRDKRGWNMAVVLMKSFSRRYKLLLAGLKLLKSLKFNMTSKVLRGYTLLMAFVEVCGEQFKAMESEGELDEQKTGHFMDVFNFLIDECDNVSHSVSHKDVDDHVVSMNVLSLSLSLGASILVLELLRRYPTLLYSVKPKTMLASLHEFPEMLEMLNSRINCKDHLRQKINEAAGGVDNQGFEPEVALNRRLTTVAAHWSCYVQKYHNDLLKLACEDEEPQESLLQIYDFFQECEITIPKAEGDAKGEKSEDKKRKSILLEKPKKMTVHQVVMQHEIFDDTRTDEDKLHSRLMRTIAASPTIKSHPMVSEYIERFYLKSFVVAVLMNLFHFVYLILFVGFTTNFVANTDTPNYFIQFHLLRPENSVGVCGYYDCQYRTCTGGGTVFSVNSRNCFADPFNNTCTICTGRVLQLDYCISNSSAKFSKCPLYDDRPNSFWITPGQYLLMGISITSFLKEVFQFLTATRTYLNHWFQNTVELVMYVLIFLVSTNFSDCPWTSGFRDSWQFTLAIIAAFISWSMMFFFMSRFQTFGTYVMMFYTSVQTGFYLLIAFVWIILAYVQMFYMLLGNQHPFKDMWVSFFKVFNMVVGDLTYDDIFNAAFDGDSGTMSTDSWKQSEADIYTRIVYFTFIVMMPIVLMNLFIGLIVGDVEKINQEAEVKTWMNCVDFIDTSHDMIKWVTLLASRLKAACSRGDEQEREEGRDTMGRTRIRLKTLRKQPLISTALGLVNGKELGRRLLACEKRKVRVKTLAKSLHSKLPFLYTAYEQTRGGEGDADGNGDMEFNNFQQEEEQEVDLRDRGGAGDGSDALRKLAVPEDVHVDDPYIRQRRDFVAFPNRLNRLRAGHFADQQMDAISECRESGF